MEVNVKNKAFTITVTLCLFAAMFLCLWRITRGVATPTEALLLSVILTIVSIVISWIVANYYANYSYDENLRTFALKAAEKVTNLSNELARLSAFLQQELENKASFSRNRSRTNSVASFHRLDTELLR